MKYKNFDEILEQYKKNHPGNYCDHPCPECGSPVSIMYGPGLSHEECTNPSCDYYFDDIFDLTDF